MYTDKRDKRVLQTAGNDKSLDTLGGRVRAIRKARGLGVTAAAKQAGLSRTSFNQWESNAVKNPDVNKLGAFAAVVDCSLDWLIRREGIDPDLTLPQPRRRRKRALSVEPSPPSPPPVLESPIPEIGAAMSLHASQVDFTARALWIIPHQVLQIGFNTEPETAVMKRVLTRDGSLLGLCRGDYVLMDTSRQRIDETGIYLIGDPAQQAARGVLIIEKEGKLEVAAFSDDVQPGNPPATVDNLKPLARVMGIFKPT